MLSGSQSQTTLLSLNLGKDYYLCTMEPVQSAIISVSDEDPITPRGLTYLTFLCSSVWLLCGMSFVFLFRRESLSSFKAQQRSKVAFYPAEMS